MTGVHFTLEDAGIQETLDAYLKKLTNTGLFLLDVGEYMMLAHRDRWDREVTPDGQAWAPLSEVTLARKAAKGRPTAILVDTTALRDLLRYSVTASQLVFGTDRVYGTTQQFGAEKGQFGADKHGRPLPWGDIPARPWLGLSDADREHIQGLLEAHSNSAAAGV